MEAKDAQWRQLVRADFYESVGVFCAVMDCYSKSECVHHIYGKQAHPALRHLPINGIPLCADHHRLAHERPKYYRQKFLGYLSQPDRDLLESLLRSPSSTKPTGE